MSPGKYKARLLRVAEEDLADIASFMATDNMEAADRVLNKIESNLTYLEKHPFMGKVPNDEELLQVGYRYLIVLDYLIDLATSPAWLPRCLFALPE